MGVVDAAGALTVSRETLARLEAYAAELTLWNKRMNLVAPATLSELWSRHIADCAQLLDLAPDGAKTWMDLGSGAGLPAVVLAIVAQECRPALEITAVESNARKCAFMTNAAHRAGAPLRVVNQRIEALATPVSDIVSARALAPLCVLLGHAEPLLARGGVCVFPKGARHREEIRNAEGEWRFQHDVVRSKTDDDAAIILVRRLHRVRS